MTLRNLSIRDILLLLFGCLTLLIILLAGRGVVVEGQRLSRIESLREASHLGDVLFAAIEQLSLERDIATALLRTTDSDTLKMLRSRLEENRRQTDSALHATSQAFQWHRALGAEGPQWDFEEHFANVRSLRSQIDEDLTLPFAQRDSRLIIRWHDEITAIIRQTQDEWLGFIYHFTNLDPIVTQHLRFKHFLRIITEYNGRERAIISRLLVRNIDPTPQESIALLRGQGVIELGWEASRVLADQSGLYPLIAPQYQDALSHYQTLHDMLHNVFYVPGVRQGEPYPIGVDMWLELADQAAESLDALKQAALEETQRYLNQLRAGVRQTIAAQALLLLFALTLCGYSFWIIVRRVIHPINTMVEALLDTSAGKPVPLQPAIAERQDEIGKLERVLAALQENMERVSQARAQIAASENRLRAVVDNALNGIITINERGIIESFNPACERLFGYKAPEVIGRNVKILMPEPYHSEHDGYVSRYVTTGEARIIGTAGREVSAQRKDGSVFPIELSVCEFQIEDGRHFSGIIHDITDRKEAEAALLDYTEALERSNRELDDFAYIASHDLKEPLRGIHNHSRFLLEDNQDKLDKDSVDKLKRLVYLSQRMERLVNDLLYFSRLGRQELAFQPTNIQEVIQDITKTLELFLTERKAKLTVAGKLPDITCDRTRVTELFRNLITNAVKYNDKPEKSVEIGFLSSHTGPKGKFRNVFYVRDNGKGIAPEFHEEIFRIFKRLQASKEGEEGTGVGLTFVKKIVERHNGVIWLESELGEGTTFYFTLEGTHYEHAQNE